MGQTTNQIEAHIESTREALGSNLRELENKVESAMDWRHHFRTHPSLLMGLAFGGGVLLAVMTSGGKSKSHYSSGGSSKSSFAAPLARRLGDSDFVQNAKAALMGIAAMKVRDFVDTKVPGFRAEFERHETKKRSEAGEFA